MAPELARAATRQAISGQGAGHPGEQLTLPRWAGAGSLLAGIVLAAGYLPLIAVQPIWAHMVAGSAGFFDVEAFVIGYLVAVIAPCTLMALVMAGIVSDGAW